MLWDRRVDSKSKQGVRALELPSGTPPWCMSVCWNHTGDKIYVGRRNETVEEWDVRMLPDATRSDSVGRSHLGRAPKHVRTLRMPRGSGPVSSVLVMPNNRHLVWCVYVRLRLAALSIMCACGISKPQRVRVFPSKLWQGTMVALFRRWVCIHALTIVVDPCSRFLLTSSGDRGWFTSSTETLLMHEIKVL